MTAEAVKSFYSVGVVLAVSGKGVTLYLALALYLYLVNSDSAVLHKLTSEGGNLLSRYAESGSEVSGSLLTVSKSLNDSALQVSVGSLVSKSGLRDLALSVLRSRPSMSF